MTGKKQHLDYITECGPFTIDCNLIIFSIEEVEILKKYGHWFAAIEDGTLESLTKKQQFFIDVCKGLKQPMSIHELAWFRYTERRKIEKDKGDKLYQTPQLNQDTFYSRQYVKQLRKTVTKTVWENHTQSL